MNDSGHGVIIECFGVRAVPSTSDDGLSLVGRHVFERRSGHPDTDAAELIGLLGSQLDGTALLHSTSWRFDPSRGVILTYVCCPDPAPDADGVFVAAASGHGDHCDDNPSRPHDPHADLSDVFHHGIDHLAWLDDHHRHLTASTARVAPEIWAVVRRAGRHRAGQSARDVPSVRGSGSHRSPNT